MHCGKVIAERAKKYATRVSAFALACFVVAFSVPVPSYAAELTPTQLAGTVEYSAVVYYTDDSYDRSDVSVAEYPVYDNATIKQAPLDAGKYIKYMITQMEFDDVPLNVPLRIHIIFQGYWPYVTLNPRCNMRYYAGSSWHVLNYSVVSSSFSNNSGMWRYDLIADFSLPLEATRFRLQGIVQPTTPFEVSSSYSTNQSFRLLEFSAMNPIVDQTPEDKNETDRVDGSVSDKTDESDSLLGEIGSVSKPTVDVDPMRGMDLNAFRAFTNILAIPFENSYIAWTFVTMLTFSLIAYILFGKGG